MSSFKNILLCSLLFLPAVIFAQKTQHIINYWDSAKSIKKEEGDLNNGKKNGLWISWDASGDTLQKNQYIDGKLHGKCISWMFGKGEYKYESNWDHGKAIGILKNFFRDSQNNDWHLSSTEEYAVSKDNDLTYKRWDDKGQLMAVQTYKDYKEGVIGNLIAIPEGKWFSWHENGQKRREEEYLNNSREGVWTTWHENGQKQHHIKYVNNLEEALSTSWYKNGQKEEEGNYINGKKQGIWVKWYENGQKEWEGEYDNYAKEGKWIYWYMNGKLQKETYYKNDHPIGTTMIYNYDGTKDRKIDYAKGIFEKWHTNGQKYCEGTFNKDSIPYTEFQISRRMIKEGKWIYWDNKGKKESEQYYENDVLIKEIPLNEKVNSKRE